MGLRSPRSFDRLGNNAGDRYEVTLPVRLVTTEGELVKPETAVGHNRTFGNAPCIVDNRW